MGTIATALAALKTREAALTGITTVFTDMPATISSQQLPAIIHERIKLNVEWLSGAVSEETWSIQTRILTHSFPKQPNGPIVAAESMLRAYTDMLMDDDTLSATCKDARVNDAEIVLGQVAGVECVSVLMTVVLTIHRRRA